LININLLPKALKRIREPGYWRVLAVAFPLLVGGVIVGIQVLTNQTITNLERDVQVREDQLALLQPFLAEQRDLQQRQQALRQLISIAEEVRRGRVVWTAEIANLLELLPPALDADTPSIDFQNLNMRAIWPPTSSAERFEGLSVITEMSISGRADGPETLARFVRSLENAQEFGVLFQNASRDGDSDRFTYSLTVGGFSGGGAPR
jgi:type IV pilus assembly protein PilN